MARTTDVGPLYFQRLYYLTPRKHTLWSGWPIVETATSDEIDGRYRRGRGLVFRLPFMSRALLIGLWGWRSRTEDAALAAALRLKLQDIDELDFGAQDVEPEEDLEGEVTHTPYGSVTSYRYDPDLRPAEVAGTEPDERIPVAG